MKEQNEQNTAPISDEQMGVDLNTDESQIGTTHLTDPVVNEPEIESLKTEIEQLKDKYLRQAAEFDNFKRRNAREKVELIQTASKDLIRELLEVIDDIQRAKQQMSPEADAASINEGMQLIFNKFSNILSAKGLKQMDSLHQPFDPELHEAITEIPAPSEELKGKVLDVLEQGYYLNDKIIRYAKVVVGK